MLEDCFIGKIKADFLDQLLFFVLGLVFQHIAQTLLLTNDQRLPFFSFIVFYF